MNTRTRSRRALMAVVVLALGDVQADTAAQLNERAAEAPTQLRKIKVEAGAETGVTPGTIKSTTKGEARPLEMPQTISVVTREKMDQTQAKTLVEAVSTVAGVVAGERGRRGFDDIGIRGMVFGQEKYIDGLNTMRSGYVPAEEIFGAERIEVLKGPASLLFGNVRPGGMVNIVSKRPRFEAIGEFAVTTGSHDFREATADFGRSLTDDGRSAFRVVALVNDADDVTDHVFFRNKFIAPSVRFTLGDRTDLTLLTSYQDREWLRNQGLAPKGTVLPNANGPIRRELFIGDPAFGHNDARRTRVGYALEHRWNEGWTLTQNFRWDDYEMDQRVTSFHGALAADERTQLRTGSIQHDDYRALALDTYINGSIDSALGVHELTFGVDASDKQGRLTSRTCTSANLGPVDLYAPVYGALSKATACTGAFSDNTQDIFAAGLYARDHVRLGDQLHLTFGVRHDLVTTRTVNEVTARVSSEPKDAATTGMVGVVYEIAPGVAPYASWANSFVPVSGTDAAGRDFEPETGEQLEAGVKFERDGGRQVASIAVYDLERQKVTTPDPVNAGFSIQQAEHRSRGFEAEAAAELMEGLSLTAAYAYTDAEVSKSSIASEMGRAVNNVPKHNASVWGLYRVGSGTLTGFGFGLGARYMSERTGYSYDFTIPSYTVFDAAVQYQGRSWRAALNLRNLTDKTYYSGALSNSVVTLGDTRQVLLSFTYQPALMQ